LLPGSPQHFSVGPQQRLPQQTSLAGQQISPQLFSVAPLQQVLPAQPWAGGSHGLPSQWVTSAAHTLLKQLSEQHSLSRVQDVPSGKRHCSPPVPQKRESPVKHRPGWPGPFSQQPSGQKSPSHWHWPFAQWP
jgi:hypothetical protein